MIARKPHTEPRGRYAIGDGRSVRSRRGFCVCRRFGRLTSKCSGSCGRNPFRRSRFALLRIAQRGRCNLLAICDAEFVGHKVISSQSSSSVQRDIWDLDSWRGPSAVSCPPIRVATLTMGVEFNRGYTRPIGDARSSAFSALPHRRRTLSRPRSLRRAASDSGRPPVREWNRAASPGCR